MLPLNFVRNAKESMSVLEGKLKEISQAHQSERKCLASVHTQLSQGTSSQEGGGGGGGQSLRSQLLSLSSRQKRLLECFKKQKEISLKVGELLEREVKAKKTGQLQILNDARLVSLCLSVCLFVFYSSGILSKGQIILSNFNLSSQPSKTPHFMLTI